MPPSEIAGHDSQRGTRKNEYSDMANRVGKRLVLQENDYMSIKVTSIGYSYIGLLEKPSRS